MGSGVSKRPVEAPTGGELWSIMEGEAGWVSGMDSIPLSGNLLQSYRRFS